MGEVFSGFFVGYFWFQVPAGWLGNRLGARSAFTGMGLLWAGAMALTASSDSFLLLYWSRVALGVAQAGLFAVTVMALRDWFPAGLRGRASSTITSCMSFGAVLASGLTVRLLGPLGWRGTFLAFALVSVAWALVIGAWFRNLPEEHPAVNEAELDLIRGGPGSRHDRQDGHRPEPASGRSTSAWRVLASMAGSLPMWVLCVQAVFQAFGFVFFITWFPAYLEKGHGVKLTGAGDLTMLPLAGTLIGSFTGGYLIDTVFIRTGSKWLSRSGVAATGLTLCAAATLVAGHAREPSGAVAVIALGMFFAGLAKPAQWAATIDLTGPQSAVGFAIMNMAGGIGSLTCPVVVGRMIDGLSRHGGNWNSVLYLIAGIHLAAAASWLVLNPGRPAVGAGA
jgi:MFS family permease